VRSWLLGLLVVVLSLVLSLELNEVSLARTDISSLLRGVLEIGGKVLLDGSSDLRFRENFSSLLHKSLMNGLRKGINLGVNSGHGSGLAGLYTIHVRNAE